MVQVMIATNPQSVFITGISSGIGRALARWYLDHDCNVYGIGRRCTEYLTCCKRFHFAAADLGQPQTIAGAMLSLTSEVSHFDLVILNAGVLGQFGDLGDAQLSDLQQTMQINVWANKTILDTLYSNGKSIGQVVAISSGASVNGNRGWSGYSISKSALNMLVKLYAKEQSQSHFCSFSPGLIATAMQDELQRLGEDERFPSLARIREKVGTAEMPAPQEAAPMLAKAFASLPTVVDSGEYADIRSLHAR